MELKLNLLRFIDENPKPQGMSLLKQLNLKFAQQDDVVLKARADKFEESDASSFRSNLSAVPRKKENDLAGDEAKIEDQFRSEANASKNEVNAEPMKPSLLQNVTQNIKTPSCVPKLNLGSFKIVDDNSNIRKNERQKYGEIVKPANFSNDDAFVNKSGLSLIQSNASKLKSDKNVEGGSYFSRVAGKRDPTGKYSSPKTKKRENKIVKISTDLGKEQ